MSNYGRETITYTKDFFSEFKKDKSNWVSAGTKLQLEGSTSKGRGRKTWNECVKVDMKRRGFSEDDAPNRDRWKSLTIGNRPTLPQCCNEGVILYGVLSLVVVVSLIITVSLLLSNVERSCVQFDVSLYRDLWVSLGDHVEYS